MWSRLQVWLLTAGAALLVLVGAYAAGGRASRRATEIKQARNTTIARRNRDEALSKLDEMDTDTVRDRIRERLRERDG